MKKLDVTIDELNREIDELRNKYHKLPDEDLFTLWFLLAYITDDQKIAADAITNESNDKGIDAILIDHPARNVCLIQSKYRFGKNIKNEARSDVMQFAELPSILHDEDRKQFNDFIHGATPLVSDKLSDARKNILKRDYRLSLYYATLGSCSSNLRKEAENNIKRVNKNTHIDILDYRRLMILLRDYLDGVAPPIPSIDLEMEKGQGIKVNGIYQRYDSRSNIESWVFSMQGNSIADLFESGGKRLFARNIRGFLGDTTSVNDGMKNTLESEADRFFYYNNGITIICDEAKKESYKGRDILRVGNPQIINGQQTTRMLSVSEHARKASVMVKVIQVPRNTHGGGEEFDSLISQIVAGTNWQNAIRPSDLMSNDRRQIELERELRKYRYLYLRKRQSRSEAKRVAGGKYYWTIYKEELAQAVAGCDLDPVIVRSGKDKLFEEDLYSHVFPNSDPNYYLPRYLLSREVTYCAKGYPERAYAKWLVLGFVWSQLAPIVRSARNAESFRILAEGQKPSLVDPLYSAINKVFVAVLRYYRANRGQGMKAVDVSVFFRNKKGRDREFQTFWSKGTNKSRKGFDPAWKKVKAAIVDRDK